MPTVHLMISAKAAFPHVVFGTPRYRLISRSARTRRSTSGGISHSPVEVTRWWRFDHPTVAGEMLVLLAWPFEFAAPITLIMAPMILIVVALRIISEDEAEMLAEFGDEYAAYMRQTDNLIPNVW